MNKKRAKKQYFKGVIRGLDRKIWDIDISIEGRKNIREGIRIEYDRKKEIVDGARIRIAEETKKEKSDFELVKKLTVMIAQHAPEIEALAGQMAAMDWDIDHEVKEMSAGELRKIIDGMKDVDKEFQTQVYKSLDILKSKDKGGLKQKKEATIEYQRLIQKMIKKL